MVVVLALVSAGAGAMPEAKGRLVCSRRDRKTHNHHLCALVASTLPAAPGADNGPAAVVASHAQLLTYAVYWMSSSMCCWTRRRPFSTSVQRAAQAAATQTTPGGVHGRTHLLLAAAPAGVQLRRRALRVVRLVDCCEARGE